MFIKLQDKIIINIVLVICIILFTFNTTLSEVQWVSEVIGFSSEKSPTLNSAKQVIGKPSVLTNYGLSPCAWTTFEEINKDEEWIIVKFENPIYCEQVAIHENLNPGAISKIYLYDENDIDYLVYETKNFPYMDEYGRIFYLFMDKTKFKVKSLKLFLNSARVPGYNYIDAIGISDNKDSIKVDINLSKNNSNFAPVNLGTNINTIYPELAPVISYDGNFLFFNRNLHPDNYGENKTYDIWFSELDTINGEFKVAKNIGRPLNNEGANFAVSIMPGNNEIIIGNVYNPDGKMTKGLSNSFTDGNIWSVPQEININGFVNKSYKGAVNYCISSSGKKMIISMEDETTLGKNDLYVSFLQKDGNWSKPKNLDKDINTASSEETPFMASDGKTLYFSTSGRSGYGQNDLFVSKRLDETWEKWSEPINLGKNINSSGWDGYYTISALGDYAYYVSNSNTFGNEDIFKIKLEEDTKPEPVVLITGRVFNSKDSNSLSSIIKYEDLDTGEEIGIARSNPLTGEYKIILPAGKNYGFLAETKGFVAINENLNLKDVKEFKELISNLTLVPIESGQKVRLNNIFFDFKSFELLPQSFSELNRVVELLNDNTDIRIEIQGHTDNVGSNERNKLLSENRALSVYNYLLSKNIPKTKIHSVGFGKDKPIYHNDTEDNRAKNRRVEFMIIK